jgi:deoxyribonuclease V
MDEIIKLNYAQAIALQNLLAKKLILKPPQNFLPRLVAGADMSYSRKSGHFYGAMVILRLKGLELVEKQAIVGKIKFPYIPGLLSFREAPLLIKVFKQLRYKPDTLLVDGQGIAHPRRFGLASHLGVCLNLPTIGCAKSRLIGKYQPLPESIGNYSLLKDKGNIIGFVLRTKRGVKPIFVSPGHLMDISTAYKIVMASLKGYRLPEPIRLAHQVANQARTKASVTAGLT